jgi:hypothetical protein
MRNSPAQVLHYAFSNYWGLAAVIVLALLLWLPRLSDPIDLRWDGAFIIFSGHCWPVAMSTASQANQDRLSLCNIFRCSRLLLDRYSGNPLLIAVAILLRRGFRKAEVQKLQLQSRGMEFGLEMIINATMHRLFQICNQQNQHGGGNERKNHESSDSIQNDNSAMSHRLCARLLRAFAR